MINSHNKEITKAAGLIAFATFLSRIFGFLRDVIIAKIFGTGMAADAFFVAFRIPNILRRLVGEGVLTVAFIPVFTEYLQKKDREEAFEFANALYTVLLISLFIFTILGIIFSPWIVQIIAGGFREDPQKFALTVILTRIMFPFLLFVGMVAYFMGLLNSMNHFFAPALAPVLLNIGIIFGAVILAPLFYEPVIGLSLGVIIGGFAQFIFQIPFLKGKEITLKWRLEPFHPGILKVLTLMLPSVFALAVTQLNIFISTRLATHLPEGSVSYLYYADRFMELPLGIFAISVATAMLPTLSRQASQGEIEELKETLSFSLRLVFFFTIPSMFLLISLRVPILNLLFQRGSFDYTSTMKTADALLFYSLGLWAFSGVRLITPVFYSFKDTITPVIIASIAVIVNLITGIILMFPLKHGGLALATSIAACCNFILLLIVLRRRIGSILRYDLLKSLGKITIASIFAALGAHFICSFGSWREGGFTFQKTFIFGASLSVAIAIFIFLVSIMRLEEAGFFLKIISRVRNTVVLNSERRDD